MKTAWSVVCGLWSVDDQHTGSKRRAGRRGECRQDAGAPVFTATPVHAGRDARRPVLDSTDSAVSVEPYSLTASQPSLLPSALCLLALACCLLLAGCGVRKPAPSVQAGRPRIVSLSPNVTEMICAIGAADCLVGRSKVCDYPAEAVKDVPVVGDFCSPSLEKLAAVRPTLVLEVDAADAATNRRLTELGIPVRDIVCARLDDIPRALREIGTCTGHIAEAERLAAEFEAELARLRREQPPPEARPLTFVEIWPDPLMTAGRTSFIAELVRLAGGRNAGDTLEREYAHVSAEWLVACDPGVVLCLNDAPTSRDPLPAWRRRNGMSGLRAVKSGRVYGSFDLNVLLKPGPRVLQAVAELRRTLHPPHGRR